MARKLFKYSRCNAILNKLHKGYHIHGLKSLMAIKHGEISENTAGPTGEQEFRVEIFKRSEDPTNPGPVAVLTGISDGKELFVSEILRPGFYEHNTSTKGSGRALLELAACTAADARLKLSLYAVPDTNSNMSNTRLYKFYNSVGLTRRGAEVIRTNNNGITRRRQTYEMSPKTLRTKYKQTRSKFTVRRK